SFSSNRKRTSGSPRPQYRVRPPAGKFRAPGSRQRPFAVPFRPPGRRRGLAWEPSAGSEEDTPMPFGSLWIPVVVSASAVFVASCLVHMVLKYHNADHRKLPNEEAIRDVLGKAGLEPGVYFTPHCTHNQMKDPAVMAQFEKGPVAIITSYPKGLPMMPKHL